jgi:hypothetical protein
MTARAEQRPDRVLQLAVIAVIGCRGFGRVARDRAAAIGLDLCGRSCQALERQQIC